MTVKQQTQLPRPDKSTDLAVGLQDHPSYQSPATMEKLPFV